ncbi:MAG: hypothetical protein ACH350_03960 [Parachlamydiaceae bacterium]
MLCTFFLLDLFRDSLGLRKLMIKLLRKLALLEKIALFEQIVLKMLRAYACIRSKNLTIKMPKMAIFSTQARVETSLLKHERIFLQPL